MRNKQITFCKTGNPAAKPKATSAAQEHANCCKLWRVRQSALEKLADALPDEISAALPDQLVAGYEKFKEYENNYKSSQTPPPSP